MKYYISKKTNDVIAVTGGSKLHKKEPHFVFDSDFIIPQSESFHYYKYNSKKKSIVKKTKTEIDKYKMKRLKGENSERNYVNK